MRPCNDNIIVLVILIYIDNTTRIIQLVFASGFTISTIPYIQLTNPNIRIKKCLSSNDQGVDTQRGLRKPFFFFF